MSRSGLKFLAVLLSVLIAAVLFAGLDDLPRGIRTQIDTERVTLASAQKQLQAAQADVAGDFNSEPDLFRAVPASAQWTAALAAQSATLQSAAQDMAELTR